MLAAKPGEDYLKNPTPDAFGHVVERYVDVVYASARRQLADAHLAEDITQAVFILLSQKAKSIPKDRPLAAWLLTTTRYVAANARREIANRQKLERKAAVRLQESHQSEEKDQWNEVSPLLDEGLAALGESDREALILRFFENNTLREVGETLGISEDAAEKRIKRAVERMRGFFARKGVSISGTALVLGLSQRLLFETPKGLASAIASGAHPANAGVLKLVSTNAKGAVVTATKIKIASAVAAGFLLAGTGLAVVEHMSSTAPAASIATTAPPATLPPSPATQPTLEQLYGLNPDEPLRIVRNAPPSVRQQLWTRLSSPQLQTGTVPNGPFAFDWNHGKPQGPLAFAPGEQLPIDRAIINLIASATAFQPSDVVFPPDLPSQLISIPGDIVYTNTLPIDKALAGLQIVMRRELALPINLSLQDVDRKVFVLRGTFKFKRLNFVEPGNSPIPPNAAGAPLIEMYATEPFDPKRGTASGAFIGSPAFMGGLSGQWLVQNVENLIGDRKIINEATGFPGQIGWREHAPDSGDADAEKIAHDPTRVLNHFADQTGLTWSEETRRLPTIVVSIAK